ncbi:MAG TPA: helix-turn-helix domain-containing protein [Nitrososphaerales archaeon]|nr:helix-turn-helix domain-containing protein [Nitrososphaerales archaeon]
MEDARLMAESGPQAEEARPQARIDAELKGNTLRVYVYALRKKKVGVREVQRALRMSNPSLAQYHLNKLKDLGLVSGDGGEYSIVDEVKVDVMRNFLRLGTLIVPRFVFYAVFFSVFAVYLTISAAPYFRYVPVLGLFCGLLIASSAVYWYEAQRAWRSVPSP